MTNIEPDEYRAPTFLGTVPGHPYVIYRDDQADQ